MVSKKKVSRSSGSTAASKGSATKKVAKKVATKKTSSKKVASKKAPAKKAAQKKVAVKEQSASPLLGKKAPSFRLPDQNGAIVSSASLKGEPYVLYFYPKDNTPGCTTEACDFRDNIESFEELGVRVIGVSPDSSASHSKFSEKHELPFTLLADTEKTLSEAYGVWALKKNYGREYMGIVRSTYLIGKDGKIQAAWEKVRVKEHVAAILAEAEK
ncbi:MAG: thioredoxin-dependent thiol peroxidase [Polyangiaceae bacterium]|nr:thioredoxin-dependent thiol peroxidase [Polyangiaceae bacterium]